MQDMQTTMSDTLPTKRSILMEETVPPDATLQEFMSANNIARWWPEIHEKLGITSVEELRFIGRENVLKYLSGLPALPTLKLAQLASTNRDE